MLANTPGKVLTNCVGARHAHGPETFGAIFDPITAVLNNSCAPNAFAFFEGNELRVRSLKSISPGEEITICYIDPTTAAFKRQAVLKAIYFFQCRCKFLPSWFPPTDFQSSNTSYPQVLVAKRS